MGRSGAMLRSQWGASAVMGVTGDAMTATLDAPFLLGTIVAAPSVLHNALWRKQPYCLDRAGAASAPFGWQYEIGEGDVRAHVAVRPAFTNVTETGIHDGGRRGAMVRFFGGQLSGLWSKGLGGVDGRYAGFTKEARKFFHELRPACTSFPAV